MRGGVLEFELMDEWVDVLELLLVCWCLLVGHMLVGVTEGVLDLDCVSWTVGGRSDGCDSTVVGACSLVSWTVGGGSDA